MVERYSLGPIHLLPAGEGRNFKLGDRKVAVFRTRDGGVFATQASCPHRAGPLADGLLGGHALVCPLHDWLFDLKTGSSLNGNCNIKTYTVSVEPDTPSHRFNASGRACSPASRSRPATG